jgi:DnaJ-domain-containing protein 1
MKRAGKSEGRGSLTAQPQTPAGASKSAVHTMYGAEERKSRMLSAAAVIARFKDGRPLGDGNSNIFSCYETLLDITGNSHASLEVCRLLKMPEAKARVYAGEIIDLLLFNRKNDPYLSLGLPGDTPIADVKRRWKSLLLLYHPDKYSNRRDYEERAKKINESYERIRSAKGHVAVGPGQPEPIKKVKVRRRVGTKKIRRFKHLRYLPDFILALAVITALISALIFISILRHPDERSQRAVQTVLVPK